MKKPTGPTLSAVVALLLVAACPAKHNVLVPDNPHASVQATTLGPGDVIDVRIYQEADLSASYQISSDGAIQFPLIGRIDVLGKTPQEAASLIAEGLKEGYLKEPQVSIFVKEYISKRIYVTGQVAKPGVFAFEDDMNVLRAVILAGDLTRLADKNHVLITRSTASGEEKIVVSIEDIGRGEAQNVQLRPGDIVYVPESPF
jgi:polysaccharide export outer membrane protein